jgi:hypothetical protein
MEVSKESDLSYGVGYGKFFIDGNYIFGNVTVTANNWSGGVDYSSGVTQALAQLATPLASQYETNHTAEQAFNAVLNFAGASLKRDGVDTRVVLETKNGTTTFMGSKTGYAGIIDSQADVGGWPVLQSLEPPLDTDNDGMPDVWEIEMKLDPNSANANGHDLSTGYENIEVYINSLVKDITNTQKL